MLYIGIDLGTSAVKLLLMDNDGTICNVVSKEYSLSFPHPGWSEQNPEDWYEATVFGLKELLSSFDKTQVAGISFGGQMHGLVILDAHDRIIRPAILWNDSRAAEETLWLNQEFGRKRLSELVANIAFAGFTAPKLLWVRRHEPENYARISKIMLPKDYLAYKLSGIFCTDVSDASGTLYFDVRNKCWSKDMLEVCGISGNQVPEIFESSQIVGTIRPSLAEELGLARTVRIVAGAGDNAAAAIGTGTIGEGQCNISLGTSGTIFISSNHFYVDPNNALHAFAHADGGYHLLGCMLSAAACNKWWMDGILKTKDYASEQAAITEDRLGRNPVFFLPYLMGERSPHNDPTARSAFIGMSMDTGRAAMLQAILEGVAFAMRDSLEVTKSLGISIARSKISGGGAKSALWRKIFANVLNINIDVLSTEEGPSLGAAMLAAVGCGEMQSMRQATDRVVRVIETIEPNPAIAERYEMQYQKFRKIYPALKEVFPAGHN